MTTISIHCVPSDSGGRIYQAVSGNRYGDGNTPGAALDAITPQLSEPEAGLLVVLQGNQADLYFSSDERDRLAALMQKWRNTRDRGADLPPDEQAELESLTQAELRATGRRAQAMADSLER